MRYLATAFVLLSMVLVSTAFVGANAPAPSQNVQDGFLIASADEAAIGAPPQQVTISDHYGDPDGFMKYIIRKPPVRA